MPFADSQTSRNSILAMDALWAAAGVSEIVEENMANAARVHAVERGFDVAGRTLVAFGGVDSSTGEVLIGQLRAPEGSAVITPLTTLTFYLSPTIVYQSVARPARAVASISPPALFALLRYSWPGNVRELKHAMVFAAAICTGIAVDG